MNNNYTEFHDLQFSKRKFKEEFESVRDHIIITRAIVLRRR